MRTLLRRLHYLARFMYWAIRHRSASCARWVLTYEGIKW